LGRGGEKESEKLERDQTTHAQSEKKDQKITHRRPRRIYCLSAIASNMREPSRVPGKSKASQKFYWETTIGSQDLQRDCILSPRREGIPVSEKEVETFWKRGKGSSLHLNARHRKTFAKSGERNGGEGRVSTTSKKAGSDCRKREEWNRRPKRGKDANHAAGKLKEQAWNRYGRKSGQGAESPC